jgi:hypothetical protein
MYRLNHRIVDYVTFFDKSAAKSRIVTVPATASEDLQQ